MVDEKRNDRMCPTTNRNLCYFEIRYKQVFIFIINTQNHTFMTYRLYIHTYHKYSLRMCKIYPTIRYTNGFNIMIKEKTSSVILLLKIMI